MGFEFDRLRAAVAQNGQVARVVIARVHGSSPREVGAAMLVWDGGQSGTIGGGALEYQLARAARAQTAPSRLSQHALGPEMNQCCGGRVEVLTELYDAARIDTLTGPVITRPVTAPSDMPLSVKRLLAQARNQGTHPAPQLIDGWMIEPVAQPTRQLWIWGAGHVGRALVHTLGPLPDIAITWVDTGPDRFPTDVPDRVTALPATDPARLIPHAPQDVEHLILTYSHTLDLALCHGLLSHGFLRVGLIGSKTKWARFRTRLAALGHSPAQIARIDCPIGDPALGKHPQAIAVGVASALLSQTRHQDLPKEKKA